MQFISNIPKAKECNKVTFNELMFIQIAKSYVYILPGYFLKNVSLIFIKLISIYKFDM